MLDREIKRGTRWRVALFGLFAPVFTLATTPAATPAAPGAANHPIVAGFERFHAVKADVVGGRLLLGELNCVSCHRPEAVQEPALPRKQAPILDGVGSRVRRGFLRKFLTDPQAVKPGTTMPNLLAALSENERKQTVEALVHFLASTGTLRQERPQPKLIAQGRELYQRVGCVACHGSRDAAGNVEKVTPSSVPHGDLKGKYSLSSLTAFLQNPHQVRPSGRMPGLLLTDPEARAIANYLLQGVSFKSAPPNLAYSCYEGSWQKLPRFDGLKPVATGKVGGFDVSVARRQNNVALRFEGFVRIDREGDYRLYLSSDDGSKLFIHDRLVVANDGVHPPSTQSGVVHLTRGMHPLVVGVFNAGGGFELNVEIEGPGLGRQPLAAHVFLTAQGNPKPVASKKDDEDFPIDAALVEKGQALFASLGCASCHQLKLDGKPIASKKTANGLAKMQAEDGCLAATPAAGLPRYPLSAVQRSALALALKSLASGKAVPTSPGASIVSTLTTFNCYACHQRDKFGGLEDELSRFFVTTQPEMGEEGRVPPSLTGVGAKMNHDYFGHIWNDGLKDRPYMLTRMPKFGAANVGHLTKDFESADPIEEVKTPHFTEKLSRVKADARFMVGGNAFGCVKCHLFAGHKAEGVQGIDMIRMTQRVKHDWFHRYVRDPQRFRPGTRMPNAWPITGPSSLPKILGGSSDKQIEAIWLYLADGGRAALPLGLNKKLIALIPGKTAILYRNFIEGAGSRAIGVGYPEKGNLAFDANEMRLSLIWQGAFMDAARHWTDRGVGYERPLGDNVLHLPAGAAFAVLDSQTKPWPAGKAKENGYRFRGYRLTPDDRPTFLYTFGDVRVEDFPNFVESNSSPVLKRSLSLTTKKPVENLYFRAVVADKIEPLDGGWYRINGEWKLRIEGAKAQVRTAGGKKELLVPISFQEGKARIVEEIVW